MRRLSQMFGMSPRKDAQKAEDAGGLESKIAEVPVPATVYTGDDLHKKDILANISRKNVIQFVGDEELVYCLGNAPILPVTQTALAIDTTAHCILLTSRRLVQVEEYKVVAEVLRHDIAAVRHQMNGKLSRDKMIITVMDGKTVAIPCASDAGCDFFVKVLDICIRERVIGQNAGPLVKPQPGHGHHAGGSVDFSYMEAKEGKMVPRNTLALPAAAGAASASVGGAATTTDGPAPASPASAALQLSAVPGFVAGARRQGQRNRDFQDVETFYVVADYNSTDDPNATGSHHHPGGQLVLDSRRIAGTEDDYELVLAHVNGTESQKFKLDEGGFVISCLAGRERLQVPVNPAPLSDNSRKEGWIQKMGTSLLSSALNVIKTNWRSRYVIITGNFLFYYTSEKRAKARRAFQGKMSLLDATIDKLPQSNTGKPFAFKVTSKLDRMSFTFCVPTDAELLSWIMAIREVASSKGPERLRQGSLDANTRTVDVDDEEDGVDYLPVWMNDQKWKLVDERYLCPTYKHSDKEGEHSLYLSVHGFCCGEEDCEREKIRAGGLVMLQTAQGRVGDKKCKPNALQRWKLLSEFELFMDELVTPVIEDLQQHQQTMETNAAEAEARKAKEADERKKRPAYYAKPLNLVATSNVTQVWNDRLSGAKVQVSVWRPDLPSGYVRFGDCATVGHAKPTNPVLIAEDHPSFVKPKSYTHIWYKQKGWTSLWVWRPEPPDDTHVAMGHVCTTSADPPSLDIVRCVDLSYLLDAKSSFRQHKIWTDEGSGGEDGGFWNYPNLNTFLCASGTHEPYGGTYFKFRPERNSEYLPGSRPDLQPHQGFWTMQWNTPTEEQEHFSVWRAEIPDGFVRFGDYAKVGLTPPSNVETVWVARDHPYFRHPVDYRVVWKYKQGSLLKDIVGSVPLLGKAVVNAITSKKDKRSDKKKLLLWEPIPPSDEYVALGLVATQHNARPSLDLVRCVSKRILLPNLAHVHQVWHDTHSYSVFDPESQDVALLSQVTSAVTGAVTAVASALTPNIIGKHIFAEKREALTLWRLDPVNVFVLNRAGRHVPPKGPFYRFFISEDENHQAMHRLEIKGVHLVNECIMELEEALALGIAAQESDGAGGGGGGGSGASRNGSPQSSRPTSPSNSFTSRPPQTPGTVTAAGVSPTAAGARRPSTAEPTASRSASEQSPAGLLSPVQSGSQLPPSLSKQMSEEQRLTKKRKEKIQQCPLSYPQTYELLLAIDDFFKYNPAAKRLEEEIKGSGDAKDAASEQKLVQPRYTGSGRMQIEWARELNMLRKRLDEAHAHVKRYVFNDLCGKSVYPATVAGLSFLVTSLTEAWPVVELLPPANFEEISKWGFPWKIDDSLARKLKEICENAPEGFKPRTMESVITDEVEKFIGRRFAAVLQANFVPKETAAAREARELQQDLGIPGFKVSIEEDENDKKKKDKEKPVTASSTLASMFTQLDELLQDLAAIKKKTEIAKLRSLLSKSYHVQVLATLQRRIPFAKLSVGDLLKCINWTQLYEEHMRKHTDKATADVISLELKPLVDRLTDAYLSHSKERILDLLKKIVAMEQKATPNIDPELNVYTTNGPVDLFSNIYTLFDAAGAELKGRALARVGLMYTHVITFYQQAMQNYVNQTYGPSAFSKYKNDKSIEALRVYLLAQINNCALYEKQTEELKRHIFDVIADDKVCRELEISFEDSSEQFFNLSLKCVEYLATHAVYIVKRDFMTNFFTSKWIGPKGPKDPAGTMCDELLDKMGSFYGKYHKAITREAFFQQLVKSSMHALVSQFLACFAERAAANKKELTKAVTTKAIYPLLEADIANITDFFTMSAGIVSAENIRGEMASLACLQDMLSGKVDGNPAFGATVDKFITRMDSDGMELPGWQMAAAIFVLREDLNKQKLQELNMRFKSVAGLGDERASKRSMQVVAVGGEALAAKDPNGFSDPYLVMKLVQAVGHVGDVEANAGALTKKKKFSFFDKKEKKEDKDKAKTDKFEEDEGIVLAKRRTPHIEMTLNPKWNHTFDVQSDLHIAGFTDIKFEVWDWDKLSADDFMGYAVVTRSHIEEQMVLQRSTQISADNDESTDDSKCTLNLKLLNRPGKDDEVKGSITVSVRFYFASALSSPVEKKVTADKASKGAAFPELGSPHHAPDLAIDSAAFDAVVQNYEASRERQRELELEAKKAHADSVMARQTTVTPDMITPKGSLARTAPFKKGVWAEMKEKLSTWVDEVGDDLTGDKKKDKDDGEKSARKQSPPR